MMMMMAMMTMTIVRPTLMMLMTYLPEHVVLSRQRQLRHYFYCSKVEHCYYC
jgi:hypothetical protein